MRVSIARCIATIMLCFIFIVPYFAMSNSVGLIWLCLFAGAIPFFLLMMFMFSVMKLILIKMDLLNVHTNSA